MASFDTSYNTYIKPIEGGYVNDPNDKGGETYGGIARNYNPNWPGWTSIDYTKRVKGPIKRYTKFPELDYLVYDFYKKLWDKNYFGSIKSQEVADILFDWYVNSGSNAFYTKSTKTNGVQEILNKLFNAKVSQDGAMGMQTVNAINAVDPVKLQHELKNERLIFYNNIIANDPSQIVFKDGWLNRLNHFKDLVTPTTTGVAVVLLAIGAGIFFLVNSADKKPAL